MQLCVLLLYVTMTSLPASQVKIISNTELQGPFWDVVQFREAETNISSF